MITKQEEIVECSNCHASHPLASAVKQRPLPDSDKVKAKEGIIDVGVECPNCNQWTHAYYLTPRLSQLQERIEKAKKEFLRVRNNHTLKVMRGAEKAYKKVFDETNKALRQRLGTVSPGKLLQALETLS